LSEICYNKSIHINKSSPPLQFKDYITDDERIEGKHKEVFMQRVYDFLKKAGTYYLATVDIDQPRIRPFGTVDLFEGKLYIQTGKTKAVSKQMQVNPKVEICAIDEGKWIRIQACAIRDDRVEAKQHMLDNYPSLQAMYSAADDNTEVLYLKNAVATIYSFTEEPIVIKF
jgi:uncharacterized pyridoxamine 5'-phosphate oxidase family protein